MRYTIIICLLSIAVLGKAQDFVQGQLLDSDSAKPLPFAHVSNYSQKISSVTSENGYFRITADSGDTVVFSSVGYETLGWIVDESWENGQKKIKLPQDTLLLDDVIVSDIPPEAIFKQRIIDYQPEDTTFWYHGMPRPQERNDPMLSEKSINNPLFAVLQPTDFLYHKFSKREKERRKYHKIVQRASREQAAYTKFSREWVREVTELEGDELTDFIYYCDYSLEYLEKTPKYLILEDMLAKLESFKKESRG